MTDHIRIDKLVHQHVFGKEMCWDAECEGCRKTHHAPPYSSRDGWSREVLLKLEEQWSATNICLAALRALGVEVEE